MVRVFYDCDNTVDTIVDLYDLRAEVVTADDVFHKQLKELADYISMCFGTHHDGKGYNTYLEYVEFNDYRTFEAALGDLGSGNLIKAFTKVSRFAIGVVPMED